MRFDQRKVLVLNRNWHPVDVIPLERALCLIVDSYDDTGEPKARVLDASEDFRLFTWEDWGKLRPKDGEDAIQGASRKYKIPEIVLLSRYNRLPQQRLNFNRRAVFRRDRNQCQYCGKCPGTSELTLDHVHPKSKGGLTTWDNCCVCCVECNRKKADRTLKQANMSFFHKDYKPYKPKFTIYKGEYRCKSWEHLLSASYWLTELENQNK